MKTSRIPVIDIDCFETAAPMHRANLARLVDDTFRDTGFMTITGHGVSKELLDSADVVARKFFALSAQRKAAASIPGRKRGYVPFGEVSAARGQGDQYSPTDLKEAFVVGPPGRPEDQDRKARPEFLANVRPDEPADFAAIIERYYREMERLSFRLLRIFALALRLPEEFFSEFYSAHNCVQRLQYYPAQSTPPLPGQLRISAHTDVGAFAIVGVGRGEGQGGLQLLDKHKEWIDVPELEYSFVVNVGDLLSVWTNDRWQSTLHRVANPPTRTAAIARNSIAFHANPNFDALIEALPTCVDPGVRPVHPPLPAGEHRNTKIGMSNPTAYAQQADARH
jgi:isopenicillin N synthase-like dioxygenase